MVPYKGLLSIAFKLNKFIQLVCVGRGKVFCMSDGAPFGKAICKSSIANGCISYFLCNTYIPKKHTILLFHKMCSKYKKYFQ